MNLTWHIVKKDLRALKWPLLVWALIVAFKLGVGATLLTADGTEDQEWFLRLNLLAKLLAGLEGMCFVLVAALIHEDRLVGTTAFWMTRPISGARLLGAKLLGLGLVFWLGPVLVSLPWWLWCGYGWPEIGWAAAELVAIQTIFMLVGLLWAVVTDGYARFLMWTLVMIVAVLVAGVLIGQHFTRTDASVSSEVATSRITVILALAVAGIGSVVAHQFLTRRLGRSIALIGATVGLIVMTALWWPWDLRIEARWLAYQESRVEEKWAESSAPAGLTFSLSGAEFRQQPPGSKAGRPLWLRTTYRVDGLPEATALKPYVANYSLRWPDGASRAGWSAIRPGKNSSHLVEVKAVGRTVASVPEAEENAGSDLIRVEQSVPAATAARLLSAPAAYTLKARFWLMTVESVESVPLHAGPAIASGNQSERIAHVEKEGDQLLVTFVRRSPALAVDSMLGARNYILGAGMAMAQPFAQYLLVNRARDFAGRGSALWTTHTRIGTVDITWQTMAYRVTRNPAGRRPTMEAINALNEAQLVRVNLRESARFTQELKTDALQVEVGKP
ncbi:MAG: hypothetical protein JNG82_12215 [Opitutaceae bacterium]|nr:hypothetical protein [Opitutaceae bacterium]